MSDLTAIKNSPPNNVVTIDSVKEWEDYVVKNWSTLKQKAEDAGIQSPYQQMMMIALSPLVPESSAQFQRFIKLLKTLRHTQALVKRFEKIYDKGMYSLSAKDIVTKHLDIKKLNPQELAGLDWVLMATGTLFGFNQKSDNEQTFIADLLKSFKSRDHYPSAVRVQAGMISAGQNVIFAGQDAQIITNVYQGDTASLKRYLSGLRSDWDMPATTIHPRSQHYISARLHQLYTPIDTWIDDPKNESHDRDHVVNTRWYRAINRELHDERMPALEALAQYPLLVVTGGAGSGKSSLVQFLVTALAYACDNSSEKRDKVSGLELMGSAWIHGELLPIFVSLRDLSNSSHFPKSVRQAGAKHLLAYIMENAGSFGTHLESYLTGTEGKQHSTVLVLDGLDEVYAEKDRVIIRNLIEKWVASFPSCRVIVTCRTYAYNKKAKWRLSERFKSVELAPYTRSQMTTYIDRWYQHAATTRPGSLGGRNTAKDHAKRLAKDIKNNIDKNKSLLPLARHPLMLVLLTLIHEDYKHLPNKRAELYAQTVELLDRWNIESRSDKLHEKLANLDLERMRAALKMIAFDLQARQLNYQRYPTTIERCHLLGKLKAQQEIDNGLGANIEDVLEYLATRNGILVSDTREHYRFPHLSIQEYLCACALIEFYDECPMPEALKTPAEGWTFPKNLVTLLQHDTTRWRNVARFAGSILAAGMGGQDMRWQLIDELLPPESTEEYTDSMLQSISVASEIWAESYLKARMNVQRRVRDHLIKSLKAIKNNQRLDVPDNAKNLAVLAELEKDDA